MLVLALDTASPTVTVGLHDGRSVLAARAGSTPLHHGEQLAPSIASLLGDAGASARDLTDVAVGVGPGPYTGLRVGLVTARTLGDSLDVPVHGVCSLDVLAEQARLAGTAPRFCVATDARRREVYHAVYEVEDDRARRIDGPHVGRPTDLAARLRDEGLEVLGRGADLHADDLPRVEGPADPDAGVLAALVATGRAEVVAPEPLYLRRPDATPPGQRKPAS